MSMKNQQICKYRTTSLLKIHHLEELVCLRISSSREISLCLHFLRCIIQFLAMHFSSNFPIRQIFPIQSLGPFDDEYMENSRRYLLSYENFIILMRHSPDLSHSAWGETHPTLLVGTWEVTMDDGEACNGRQERGRKVRLRTTTQLTQCILSPPQPMFQLHSCLLGQ